MTSNYNRQENRLVRVYLRFMMILRREGRRGGGQRATELGQRTKYQKDQKLREMELSAVGTRRRLSDAVRFAAGSDGAPTSMDTTTKRAINSTDITRPHLMHAMQCNLSC